MIHFVIIGLRTIANKSFTFEINKIDLMLAGPKIRQRTLGISIHLLLQGYFGYTLRLIQKTDRRHGREGIEIGKRRDPRFSLFCAGWLGRVGEYRIRSSLEGKTMAHVGLKA